MVVNARHLALAALLVLPVLVIAAQGDVSALKAEIRARLALDSNAAQMSPESYAAIVDALAGEAQRQGLDASAFSPTTQTAAVGGAGSPVSDDSLIGNLSSLFGISISAALWWMFGAFVALLALLSFIVHHVHRKHRAMASIATQ